MGQGWGRLAKLDWGGEERDMKCAKGQNIKHGTISCRSTVPKGQLENPPELSTYDHIIVTREH